MTSRWFVFAAVILGVAFGSNLAAADDVADLQARLAANGASWTAGETSMSRLTPEQMREFLTLDLDMPDNWEEYLENSLRYEPPRDMPTALDWRAMDGEDYSTPIKDQDPCGTCQTFCFMAATEALLKIHQGNSFIQPDLSEQHVYSCDGPIPYTLFHPAIYMTSNGAADESCMPYNCDSGYRQPCDEKCGDWSVRSLKISDWKMYMFPNPETIKGLLQYGPIVAGFQVFADFQNYTGGVYEHVEGGILGGHGVAVFGYGEDEEGGYWICKNSWGANWGEDGWFKIRWGSGLLGFGYQSMSIEVTDESLCSQNTAPAISQLVASNEASALADGEAPRIVFEYSDINANLAGGELWYRYDDGDDQRFEAPLTDCVGVAAVGDKGEYELAAPTSSGGTLSVWVRDTCGADSNVLTLDLGGESGDDDATDDDAADDDADDDAAGDDGAGGESDSGDDDDDGACCG